MAALLAHAMPPDREDAAAVAAYGPHVLEATCASVRAALATLPASATPETLAFFWRYLGTHVVGWEIPRGLLGHLTVSRVVLGTQVATLVLVAPSGGSRTKLHLSMPSGIFLAECAVISALSLDHAERAANYAVRSSWESGR